MSGIVGIGLGMKSVDFFREKTLESDPKFYKEHFSDHEIEYALRHKLKEERFAARWAAKEALSRASAMLKFEFSDVEVQAERDQPPLLKPGEACQNKALLEFFKTHQISLSLTHENDLALATVLLSSKC